MLLFRRRIGTTWLVWLSLLLFALLGSALATTVPSAPQTTHFRVGFDGCFRPPRDPGFPTIPHRKAVCAACISMVHENDTGNSTLLPLSVGARIVPVMMDTTSQHAEYEGLLMGLEWLVDFFSCQKNEKLGQTERCVLTIEGDCKTVIDQLTGKSNPRKLEELHGRAQDLMNELKAVHPLQAEIRHIPRDENSISDGLCNNLMSILDSKTWIESIEELEQVANGDEDSLSSQESLATIFETAAKTTKFSLRPYLYDVVANLAMETKNHELLVNIGERMVEEEKSLAGKNNKSNALEKSATSIRKRGVIYQIQGWKKMEKPKKMKFLQRKHRVLLNDYDVDRNDDDDESRTEFFSWIQDMRFDTGDPNSSIHQKLVNLGHITEGEWDESIVHDWKVLLDKWFDLARNQEAKAEPEEDTFSPLWIVDDAIIIR